MMKQAVSIFGVLLAVAGVVWILQGIGLLQGSVMTNHPEWAVIGVIVILIGGGLTVWINRKPPAPPAA